MPEQVLDMSLDTLNAVIEGYSDRMAQQQVVAVQTGYWAAYYTNAKRPKPIKTIIAKMLGHLKKAAGGKQAHMDTVDVTAFLDREAAFNELKAKQGG